MPVPQPLPEYGAVTKASTATNRCPPTTVCLSASSHVLSCFINKLIDANVALALDMIPGRGGLQVKVSIEAIPRIVDKDKLALSMQ